VTDRTGARAPFARLFDLVGVDVADVARCRLSPGARDLRDHGLSTLGTDGFGTGRYRVIVCTVSGVTAPEQSDSGQEPWH
jgi:hypothetical protein